MMPPSNSAMHSVMKLRAAMLPQPIASSTGALTRRAMPNPMRPAKVEPQGARDGGRSQGRAWFPATGPGANGRAGW
jgi:hypothetical protein